MSAATVTKTYFKGTVTGGDQTLVAGNTTAGIQPAGGIVGKGSGMRVSDVYAIGAVTGRGSSTDRPGDL